MCFFIIKDKKSSLLPTDLFSPPHACIILYHPPGDEGQSKKKKKLLMKWSVYKNTCLAQWQQQKFRRVERSEVLQCFYQRKSLILTFTKRSDTLPLRSTHSAPWTVPVRLWFFRVHIYCKSQWRPQRGWPWPPTGNLPAPLPPDLWQSCWLHIVSLITFFLLSNTWSWAGTQSGLQWFRRINLMFQGFYGAHLDTTVKTSKERSGAESIQ